MFSLKQINKTSRSMALVLTLLMVALISGLTVSFISYSQSYHLTNRSSVDYTTSQITAQNLLKEIVSQIKYEIYLDSDKTKYSEKTPLFYPLNEAGFLARRSNHFKSDSAFANVLRTSSDSSDVAWQRLLSSRIKTTEGDKAAHIISPQEWSLPHLANWENTDHLPTWIYLNRFGVSSNLNVTLPSNSSPQENRDHEEIITGRYAFVIYDLGGLVDINQSGSSPNRSSDEFGKKGSVSTIDLKAINGFSEKTVNQLIEWRSSNRIQKDFLNDSPKKYDSDFQKFDNEFNLKQGGRAILSGGDQILNRKDLIRAKGIILPSNESFLEKITWANRDINQPFYDPNTMIRGNFTPTINEWSGKYTAKSTFIRMNGSRAKIGEPLIKTRFPLSYCDWITSRGPKPGITSKQIQKAFGFQWNEDTGLWSYVGSSGSSTQLTISRMSQVALEDREPNFFELLKMTILDGSLGLDAGKTISDTVLIDNNVDYQIMRIGLNIIDQIDEDSHPTGVAFNNVELWGLENIPFIHKITFKSRGANEWIWWGGGFAFYRGTGFWNSGPPLGAPPYHMFLTYELWNPHQILEKRSDTPSIDLQLKLSGSLNRRYYLSKDGEFFDLILGGADSPSNLINQTISLSTSPKNFSNPTILKNFSTGRFGDTVTTINAKFNNYNGTILEYTSIDGLQNFVQNNHLAVGFDNYSASLGINASGRLLNYGHFSGVKNIDGTVQGTLNTSYNNNPYYLIGSCPYSDPLYFGAPQFTIPNGPQQTTTSVSKLDPRTSRFGVYSTLKNGNFQYDGMTMRSGTNILSQNGYIAPPTTIHTPSEGIYVNNYSVPFGRTTQNYGNANNPPSGNTAPFIEYGYPISSMAENRYLYNNVTPRVYRDRDSIQRWGDSALDPGVISGAFQINPMDLNSTTNRPIILDQKFQSIGDLGHVYRDMPWKTLDLFTTNSADAGLLEVFTAHEQPLVTSGKINLNSASEEAVQAIVSGTRRSPKVLDRPTDDLISQSSSKLISQTIKKAINRTTNLTSQMDLVTKLSSDLVNSEFPATKFRREAVVRALSETTTTRTWNLMIDLVYQKGSLSPFAKNSVDFDVRYTHRYWLHLSIDRFSGKIIDSSFEEIP